MYESQHVAGVPPFRCIDTIVTEEGNSVAEVRSCIEQARSVHKKMSKVLASRQLGLDLQIRILRYHVFSVFLYGT